MKVEKSGQVCIEAD